jgi:predicted alpha/beta-fold hydrolase
MILSDGDFMDLDWVKQSSKSLLILIHGLEGSSQSTYIKSACNFFSDYGWDICAVNLRSCSGEINLAPRLYHHGTTEDLNEVMLHVHRPYQKVFLLGFSLGGNQVLKYLGEQHWEYPESLLGGVAISAPIDLVSCVNCIHKPAQKLYHDLFLTELKEKVRIKAKQFPNIFDSSLLNKTLTLRDFDNFFTAPVFGFKDGMDYYLKASSIGYLQTLRKPTMLLNALDDPMLGPSCFPVDLAESSTMLSFVQSNKGGHVGFLQGKKIPTLAESLAKSFFDTI